MCLQRIPGSSEPVALFHPFDERGSGSIYEPISCFSLALNDLRQRTSRRAVQPKDPSEIRLLEHLLFRVE